MKRQVYIVPSYKCNNRCKMCGVFNTKKDSNWEYTEEEVCNEIDFLEIEADDVAIVSGGEPTIYRHYFSMLDYLAKKGAKITIFSNGRAFKSNSFVEKMEKRSHDNILIPLFSSKPEIHDDFTGGIGNFNDTFSGLKNIDKTLIEYTVKTVVMKSNYKDLPEWATLVTKNFKNPKTVSIHGLHLQGEAPKVADELYISHKEASPYIHKALDILIENGFNVAISAFPLCNIDPVYWKYNVVSNISDYETISEDSEEIKETNLRNYTKKPNQCKECKVQSLCEWPWQMYEKLYNIDYLSVI